MSLDGFSMRPLTRELDVALAGGRIDKITQPNKQSIILSVRQPGQNFLLHISINSQNPSAHLLEKNLENPPEPPVFCMVLRKQIETGRIAQIRQHRLAGRGRPHRDEDARARAHGQVQQHHPRAGRHHHRRTAQDRCEQQPRAHRPARPGLRAAARTGEERPLHRRYRNHYGHREGRPNASP